MIQTDCDCNNKTTITSTGTYVGDGAVTWIPYRDSTTGVDMHTYCYERLPCGLCRRTNRPCPYSGYDKWEVTCLN